MVKRAYGSIGVVLWVVFVHLIAPDVSYIRSLLAAIIGFTAISLIAIGIPSSIKPRSEKGEKTQNE